jgi:hypothetical protein
LLLPIGEQNGLIVLASPEIAASASEAEGFEVMVPFSSTHSCAAPFNPVFLPASREDIGASDERFSVSHSWLYASQARELSSFELSVEGSKDMG